MIDTARHGCIKVTVPFSSQDQPDPIVWGLLPRSPDQPLRRKATIYEETYVKERSMRTELYRHLCGIGQQIAWKHKECERVPLVRDDRHRVGFDRHVTWTTITEAEMAAELTAYMDTYGGRIVSPKRQSFRSTYVWQEDAQRAVEDAARYVTESWDWKVVEEHFQAASRGGRSHAPRGKVITDDMVRPYLDQLLGLTLRQAAERLASWDWDTKKRPSVDTFRRVLRRLEFDYSQGTKRVRQPATGPQTFQGMDGLTNEQKAAEARVSVRTVYRAAAGYSNVSNPEHEEVEDKGVRPADTPEPEHEEVEALPTKPDTMTEVGANASSMTDVGAKESTLSLDEQMEIMFPVDDSAEMQELLELMRTVG